MILGLFQLHDIGVCQAKLSSVISSFDVIMKDAVQFDGYPQNFFPYKAMLRSDVFLH